MSNFSIIRSSDLVNNTNPYKSANKEYYLVYISSRDGLIPCLLTDNDITDGLERAEKNVEDIKPASCLMFLLHKLFNLFRYH